MLILKGVVGLQRTLQLQLPSITGHSINLDYHAIKWFALGTSRDNSVVFEIASKYCISDSFGWHHQLKTLGCGDGQGSLVCCSPWGLTRLSDWTELNWRFIDNYVPRWLLPLFSDNILLNVCTTNFLPFTYWRTSWLLSVYGNYEQRFCKYEIAHFCVDITFPVIWINPRVWLWDYLVRLCLPL